MIALSAESTSSSMALTALARYVLTMDLVERLRSVLRRISAARFCAFLPLPLGNSHSFARRRTTTIAGRTTDCRSPAPSAGPGDGRVGIEVSPFGELARRPGRLQVLGQGLDEQVEAAVLQP